MLCTKCHIQERRKAGSKCRDCWAAYIRAYYHRNKVLSGGQKKGEASHNWKGGSLNAEGYNQINHLGKRTYEHRVVMAAALKRALARSEVVHHWDEDRANNSLQNLALFRGTGAHSRLHKFADRHKLPVSALKFNQPWLYAEETVR